MYITNLYHDTRIAILLQNYYGQGSLEHPQLMSVFLKCLFCSLLLSRMSEALPCALCGYALWTLPTFEIRSSCRLPVRRSIDEISENGVGIEIEWMEGNQPRWMRLEVEDLAHVLAWEGAKGIPTQRA